jgi:hypothetical protein
MSNVHYKEVRLSGPSWKKRVEAFAADGAHFSVRPFQKQLHWEFLEDVCRRYGMVPRFDARDRTVYFDPESSSRE